MTIYRIFKPVIVWKIHEINKIVFKIFIVEKMLSLRNQTEISRALIYSIAK